MRGSSGQERQLHRLRAGRDDALLEADGLRLAVSWPAATTKWCGSTNAPCPHHRDLAHLGHAGQAAGQLAHDLVLVRQQLGEVDLRRAERHTEVGEVRHLVHHGGHVQQRLATGCSRRSGTRRRAWHSARPARPSCRGRRRGRRRNSRPGRRRAPACRIRGRRRRRSCAARPEPRPARRRRRCGGAGGGAVAAGDCGEALAARPPASAPPSLRFTLSPSLTFSSLTTPACVDGNLHRRLVALDGDQALLGLDRVARLDQQLDDRHVLEVADVGHLDFDQQPFGSSFQLDGEQPTGPAEFLSNSQPARTPASATSRAVFGLVVGAYIAPSAKLRPEPMPQKCLNSNTSR